ncbi:helix-turn-helix transcriptional regulator [Nocardia bhagyanarayanae]|uniref:Putative ArsR family transcriptional regulator n=1 Tax=Nocardia bhagyanarayanae TaxID=1215925 RepID=A0A543FDT2_9NOCA|nr:helix-turn-helix domain-containing protein [Nocardia bhagyanarayanae]TQM32028.1 putative ArsR family transcriptional regulator [Nocardia bhagyanarayanae]
MTTESAIGAVAVLDDELRRRMYWFIRRAHHPVTRDEAAAEVGISRKLAAFHLDKLVDAGLLRAHYEAVGGVRRVGRAPKVYEPTDVDVRVSIPERRYEVLAEILMDAVLGEGADETARDAAMRVAGRRGADIGRAERDRVKPGRLSTERALTLVHSLLGEYGFEPSRESPSCVRLRNCPFHPLAQTAPELVCGLNHAFLSGVLTGLEAASVRAALVPRAGECCVELHSTTD